MHLRVNVVPKLQQIFSSDARYKVFRGGRGSGKSWAAADYLLVKSMEAKNGKRNLCTREIQNTIKDSVYKLLSDRIEANGMSWFYTIQKDIILGANGSEFIFKGLYRNDNDIKSMEGIDYCWIEEAQSISRSSLKTLIPTIRKEGSEFIITYNPTLDGDPVNVDYTLTARPDCLNIEVNYDDNPFFPDVLRAEMEWDRAHDIDKYDHVWCGKTVKHSQAQVFFGKWAIEDFETPDGVMLRFGADWGFSVDPSTLVRCFINGDCLHIDNEFYAVGVDIDILPARFKEIPDSDKYNITADSARPETISYIKRNGFPLIRASEKGKGSVEDGIAFLRSFRKIVIHPRCKHTIDEFRSYSYVVDKLTGEVTNKVADKHNHIIDALRYSVEDLMKQHYQVIKPAGARAGSLGL